jgi:23S rRNA (cytosine1962-C5)-methyltransferase
MVHADIYDRLRAAPGRGERFDLAILDPPKLAAGRTDIQTALRRYTDLNRLACGAIAPGGTLITCSCSGAVSPRRFREAVLAGIGKAGRKAELQNEAGAAADHPLRPEFPEGRYLKVLTFRIS